MILRAGHWLSNISLDADSPIFRHWFREMSRRNTFVRYDMRGSGLSEHDPDEVSFDRFIEDIEAVAAPEPAPLTLIGMSQGAAIAIAYTVRHPERVKRLVLFGAYTRGMVARAKTDDDRMMADTLSNLILLGWGRRMPAFQEIFTRLFIPRGSPEQHAMWQALERDTATPENALRIFQANNRIDVSALAGQIKVPTLVLHSRNDARVPFDEGRRLAAMIPGARFVPLESDNHVLMEDEPAWPVFVEEFEAFMKATE